MQLKPNTEKALNVWLDAGTWHTGHPTDMDRWYDFVDQYQREHGFTIDEVVLRKNIEDKLTKKTGKRFGNEVLRNEIREQISLAYKILDFLKHTGR